MKKILVILVFVLMAVAFSKTIVLANGEWKPYLSKDLKHFGVASRVVTEAFKEAGYTVKYKWYGNSWKRAYRDAKTGKTDGTLVWSCTPEREKEMIYSKSAIISGKTDVVFYLKSKKVNFDKVSDLYKYKIGGVLGYTYGSELDKAIKDGKIEMQRVNSDILNVKKLLKGRIDCFISSKAITKKLLEDNFTPDERSRITFSKKPTRVVTYHLLLNKNPKNKAIMEAFDKGFEKLVNDGRYKEYQKDLK